VEPTVENTVSNNIDWVERVSVTEGSSFICASFLQEIKKEKETMKVIMIK